MTNWVIRPIVFSYTMVDNDCMDENVFILLLTLLVIVRFGIPIALAFAAGKKWR